jgi:PKHD-type hydroxylase
MQLKENYRYYTKALSSEVCLEIIEKGQYKIFKEKNSGKETFAYTGGNREKQSNLNLKPLNEKSVGNLIKEGDNPNNYYVRDSEVTWFDDKEIYDLIVPYAKEANKISGWNYEILDFESVQFTVYHSPGGFYGWHQDGGSDTNFSYRKYIQGISPPLVKNNRMPEYYTTNINHVGLVRKISMTINLSVENSYTGGNLKFDWGRHSALDNQYHECTEIRPQGSIIVFPSYLYHCVTPVTSGTRYSLVMWALGRPFK